MRAALTSVFFFVGFFAFHASANVAPSNSAFNRLSTEPSEISFISLDESGTTTFGGSSGVDALDGFASLKASLRGGGRAASLFGRFAAMSWTGLTLVLILIVPLPFAMIYVAWSWHRRYSTGQISLQMRDDMQFWATMSLVLYVSLLIASDTLASHTAQSHGGKYPWEPVAIVLSVEVTKLVVSVGLGGSAFSAAGATWSSFRTAALHQCPVAVIYAGNNCLALFLLSTVQLDTYVVWRNTTILFNAILWTTLLGRQLHKNQWLAVLFLFCGCCLNSLNTDGSMREGLGWPVLLMLSSAFFSALAGVLNERVLKNENFAAIGIDRLNCLLYMQTIFLLSFYIHADAAWSGRPLAAEVPRILSQLDYTALALIAMFSTLGLSVSRVLKYANSVAKNIAGGAREIVETAIAPFFVESRLDWVSFPSVLWIATAMVCYFIPGDPETPEQKEQREQLEAKQRNQQEKKEATV